MGHTTSKNMDNLRPLNMYMNTLNFVVCVAAALPHNLLIILQPLMLLSCAPRNISKQANMRMYEQGFAPKSMQFRTALLYLLAVVVHKCMSM